MEIVLAFEVITEQEALARIDMLTRERDAALGMDIERWEAEFYAELDAMGAEEFERFVRRPGYQRGMGKLEALG